MNGNDVLNFFVSAMITLFSILIGGSWFIGLLMEPEKSETFLILVSFGLLLGGVGCGLNCIYLITKKKYQWIYYLSLVILFGGYGLAFLGKTIYEIFWKSE